MINSIVNLGSSINLTSVVIGTMANGVGSAAGYFLDQTLARRRFAFTDLLPKGSWERFHRVSQLHSKIYAPLEHLSEHTLDVVGGVLIGPIIEELEFRYLLPLCLEVACIAAANSLFPGSGILAQSLAFRVTKHVLFSGFFALLHYRGWGRGEAREMGVSDKFFSGLAFSATAELSGSVVNSILSHMLLNGVITLGMRIEDRINRAKVLEGVRIMHETRRKMAENRRRGIT